MISFLHPFSSWSLSLEQQARRFPWMEERGTWKHKTGSPTRTLLHSEFSRLTDRSRTDFLTFIHSSSSDPNPTYLRRTSCSTLHSTKCQAASTFGVPIWVVVFLTSKQHIWSIWTTYRFSWAKKPVWQKCINIIPVKHHKHFTSLTPQRMHWFKWKILGH